MNFFKFAGLAIVYIAIFLIAMTYLPGIPPDAEFSAIRIKLPQLIGSTQLNNKLNNAEILFENELKGAETFASYNGELYTGIQGGYVVKIANDTFEPIVKFGEKCDGLWQESKCGRPLGMKFDKNGFLYVCDAYYGIFKVDVETKTYEKLVDSGEKIEGKVPRVFNSLDIADNGDVYWSDSSTDFSLLDGTYSMLANPSGRLIRYIAETGENVVLVKNLGFANGVALQRPGEEYVIVMETLTSRIKKYNLKGPNAGKEEMFVEGLPGLPDNVHTDTTGGYLVSLVVYADEEHPQLSQTLLNYPSLRRLSARLLNLLEAPFKCLQSCFPNSYAERVIHYVGGFESMLFLSPKVVSVIRINREGDIVDAAYSTDGLISGISSAYVHDGFLWLGSPFAEYIARVPLKRAFSDLADESV